MIRYIKIYRIYKCKLQIVDKVRYKEGTFFFSYNSHDKCVVVPIFTFFCK